MSIKDLPASACPVLGVTGVHRYAWISMWVLGNLNSGLHAGVACPLLHEPPPQSPTPIGII